MNQKTEETYCGMESEISDAMKNLDHLVISWNKQMTKREQEFKELQQLSTKYTFKEGETIKLDVGGTVFKVYKEVLDQKIKKPTKTNPSTRTYPSTSTVDDYNLSYRSKKTVLGTKSLKQLNYEVDYNNVRAKTVVSAEETTDEFYSPHFFNVLISGMHHLTIEKESGAIFIDRDPTYFNCILNYLRSQGLKKNFSLPLKDSYAMDCLYIEARYYNMEGLMELIENQMSGIKNKFEAEW